MAINIFLIRQIKVNDRLKLMIALLMNILLQISGTRLVYKKRIAIMVEETSRY